MLVYNQSWVPGTPTRDVMKEASPLFTFGKTRKKPFNDLYEGQRIVISASKGPGLGTVMYESRIRYLVTGSYNSLDEAWQLLRESIPSDVRTKGGWDKKWFMTRDYTMRAPSSGWMIGWLDVPVRWIGLPRPKSLVLQRNGWGFISEKDAQAKKTTKNSRPKTEEQIVKTIIERKDIGPRVRKALIDSRRGQGKFRSRVMQLEPTCRVTGTSLPKHLTASHIKPWRQSNDLEKLDGFNGLLLAPHIDHLFNDGFISFKDNGDILISPKLNRRVLKEWKIPDAMNVGTFHTKQRKYLKYHRTKVFQKK